MTTTTTMTDPSALVALLSAIVRDSSWIDQAACGRTDYPDLWFEGDAEWKAEARQICATCPVQQQCLARAIVSDEPHGIWGGKTPHQRKAGR